MKKYAPLLFGFLLMYSSIYGQTEQQLLPVELKQQTLITQPVTLYKGFIRAGISANYLFLDKVFNEDGDRESISNSFGKIWTLQAVFQYGLTDRLQLSAAIPYTNRTLFLSFLADLPITGTTEQIKFERSGKGIGDIDLGATYQLITATTTRPAVALRGTIFLPTGQKNPTNIVSPEEFDFPTGGGHLASELSVELRKTKYPFLFSGTVAYKYNFEGNKVFEVGQPEQNFQNGGLFSIGGLVGYHVNEWMAIINDVTYFNIAKGKIEGTLVDEEAAWVMEYIPRLTFQIKQLRINQALSFPIIGKLSGADPSYFLIVQYVF